MRAKKSLGQNFLKSEPALHKIVEAGEINEGDIVLEIGPGKGALTEKLLEKGCRVIAVEKDYELFNLLQEKFSKEIESKKLVLKNEDILDFDVGSVSSSFSSLRTAKRSSSLGKIEEVYAELRSYKIIANIPYNITGAILRKFLTETPQPERMILMVQNEVAQRIVARDKKESILSISVKAYGKPKLIMKVAARYFSPAPKVDSAIIAITSISRGFFEENHINEERFWEIVKSGFAHKRKMLSGNLKGVISANILEELGFSNKRAEDLSLEDWRKLAKHKI